MSSIAPQVSRALEMGREAPQPSPRVFDPIPRSLCRRCEADLLNHPSRSPIDSATELAINKILALLKNDPEGATGKRLGANERWDLLPALIGADRDTVKAAMQVLKRTGEIKEISPGVWRDGMPEFSGDPTPAVAHMWEGHEVSTTPDYVTQHLRRI